jgi:hypothetical protein
METKVRGFSEYLGFSYSASDIETYKNYFF